jgi:hypothetical protein
MAEDSKDTPIFVVKEGNVTHLHGAELPIGTITVGTDFTDAEVPSPDQSQLVVNGAYDFAKLLSGK